MKISYNAPAMRASNALNASDSRLSKSLGRLSSGLKVTASKDNPSGYAIGRRMNTQITGLGTATQSSNNGISVIETADGALTEVHEMLQRMNELAVKGETGTLTTSDRMTLEQEIKQLKQEITRISTDTQFNGQTLLDGTFDLRGYTNNHQVKVDYYSDEVIPKKYTISELIVAYDAEGNIDKDTTSITLTSSGDYAFPPGVEISETTKNKITLKGPLDFEMTLEVGAPEEFPATVKIPETTSYVIPRFGVEYNDVDISTGQLYPDLDAAKADFSLSLKSTSYADGVPKENQIPADAEVVGYSSYKVEGTGQWMDTIIIENKSDFHLELTLERMTSLGVTYIGGDTVEVDNEPLIIDVTGIGSMDIQTGANEGQQLAIRIPTISLNRMGLEDLTMVSDKSEADSIKACADANKAIKGAIQYVSDARSRLGAYQNRLEHTVNNLAVSSENMTASYSRIMDVDMAEEMTSYTTEQVISQAAVSMLAQANERPSQVLQLLQ